MTRVLAFALNCALLLAAPVANQLTGQERADGWELMFDGAGFRGWTLGDGAAVTDSWTIEEGAITTIAPKRVRSDLLFVRMVSDFEMTFEFRLSPGANTGVKYFVAHVLRYLTVPNSPGMLGAAGLEFQLIDDTSEEVKHADQKAGALYGLLPPETPAAVDRTGWNSARLICRSRHCEHWINGRRLLSFDTQSPALRAKLTEAAANREQSIVSSLAALVELRDLNRPMAIALQHHSSKVWFRNLKLRQKF